VVLLRGHPGEEPDDHQETAQHDPGRAGQSGRPGGRRRGVEERVVRVEVGGRARFDRPDNDRFSSSFGVCGTSSSPKEGRVTDQPWTAAFLW